MYFGELREHTRAYQLGHEKGVYRAFDECISPFKESLEFEGSRLYSTAQIVDMLEQWRDEFIYHCETYGMGIPEEDLDPDRI